MELNEMVLDNLSKIWNWAGDNKPTDFRTQDGKQWLLLNVYSLASRLRATPDRILLALYQLKDQQRLDWTQKDDKVIFSLSPLSTAVNCVNSIDARRQKWEEMQRIRAKVTENLKTADPSTFCVF